jgi:uncharacterized protein YdhG (YjbR/CyaY superfamily)
MTATLVLGRRALREASRTPEVIVPSLFIPLFFLVVNVGQAARIFPGSTTEFLHGQGTPFAHSRSPALGDDRARLPGGRQCRRDHAGPQHPRDSHLRLTMSAADVDRYLQALEEPKRSTLETLRRRILEIVPDAEQVISYRVPAFRVEGRIVAGFAAFKSHLSYLPFSGSVLPQLADNLRGYTMTKSSLHFPVDRPLPKTLVRKLIAARLRT